MTKPAPIREAILELLADGRPHHKKELHALCGPSNLRSLTSHISTLRLILRPRGEDIVCEFANRTIYYRHVRLIGGG